MTIPSLAKLISVTLLLVFALTAPVFADNDDFFSYNRFFLKTGVIESIPRDGRTQTDLSRFAVSFTDGLYYISSGRKEEARKNLDEARQIWPEYYATDFLLALTYEEEGDYRTAARYYKSYLNKLRALHSGAYRISGPLMFSIGSSAVEPYPVAYEMVKQRLAEYGINIDRVRPVMMLPEFLFYIILVIALAAIYAAIRYVAWPYFKRRYRIKHPPEGFWVCRECGAYNPDTAKVCGECNRPGE
jgi:tetratricopeptide (TPR) repeat protein